MFGDELLMEEESGRKVKKKKKGEERKREGEEGRGTHRRWLGNRVPERRKMAEGKGKFSKRSRLK